MSIFIQSPPYLLQINLSEQILTFRLTPYDFTQKNKSYYLYQSMYKNNSIPQSLSLLFSDTVQWFKYIQFYKERCIEINMNMVKQHMDSNSNNNQNEREYCQMPISFMIILIQGIQKAKLQLIGTKELYSKERKLEKIIQAQNNQIQIYKEKIQKEQQEIIKLKKIIQNLQTKNTQLQKQIQRIKHSQPIRKKVHLQVQDKQVQPLSVQSSQSVQFYSHKKNERQIQQQYEHQQSNDIQLQEVKTLSKNIQNERIVQNNENKIQSNSIRLNNKSTQLQQSFSKPQSQSQVIRNQQQFSSNNNNSTNLSNTYKKQQQQFKQIIQPQIQHQRQQKQSIIRRFVKSHCYLTVGSDSNIQRKGYCCIYCTKVFKQDQFLYKHFISKHTSQMNNVNIEKFLMDSLNGYLKMRQQRLAATEITNMIDRRLRMNEGMGGGTIGNR